MEARPPAENRHGGAPRGERPASWDAPRLTRADRRVSQTRQQHKCACRRSAHPSPWGFLGDGRDHKDKTRAQQRAAGTNNTALFDIVNAATANGSCASRDRARLPVRHQFLRQGIGTIAARPVAVEIGSELIAEHQEEHRDDRCRAPLLETHGAHHEPPARENDRGKDDDADPVGCEMAGRSRTSPRRPRPRPAGAIR